MGQLPLAPAAPQGDTTTEQQKNIEVRNICKTVS